MRKITDSVNLLCNTISRMGENVKEVEFLQFSKLLIKIFRHIGSVPSRGVRAISYNCFSNNPCLHMLNNIPPKDLR